MTRNRESGGRRSWRRLSSLALVAFCALLAFCALFACTQRACAQRSSVSLSESEVEALRDAAIDPAQRVAVFQEIINARVDRIQRVLADARAQGRAQDIHQSMEEIAGSVNELEDNIDEYAPAHKDLRKALPKLLTATDRWTSILKQPPENGQYNVTRQLALEAVADLKDVAAKLLPEQQKYFKEHPPSKTQDRREE